MLNPGNDFRFSAFFSVAAIGSNHDKSIKQKKGFFVNILKKKFLLFKSYGYFLNCMNKIIWCNFPVPD